MSSRRLSNGRSPLVNQQRQITSFFTPNNKKSPSISSNSQNPNNSKKKSVYGEQVIGKRIRVYWPLDKAWYDASVKSYDSSSGKHSVQYDDSDEELLDLEIEKIEWIKEEDEEQVKKSFRRLKRNSEKITQGRKSRRLSRASVVSEKKLMFDDDVTTTRAMEESGGDDSSYEEEIAADDDDDSEEIDDDDQTLEKTVVESKKRKKRDNKEIGSGKTTKTSGKEKKMTINGGISVEREAITERLHSSSIHNNSLTGDLAERFGGREAAKFHFLGVDRRDAKRRKPEDVNYDSRTLYLPSDFLKNLTGGQRQWWDFKSKNMDKVLFFKMGKFYELYEMDAHIGARELGLQYMKGDQPHCGFPEKNFTVNVEKLAKKGFRVLVVEQTETPAQLEKRRKEKGSKDKVVRREICAVVTKGTLTEGEILATNPEPSYLMAVTERFQFSEKKEENLIVGVCVVDVSTSRFMLGQFGDDPERNLLSTLLSELRPVEIIKPSKVLSSESEKVLSRHTRSPLINELVPLSEFWDADRTVDEVKEIYRRIKDQHIPGPVNSETSCTHVSSILEDGLRCLPDVLSELVVAGDKGSSALSAFGGCLFYLRQAFLDETLLRFAKFEILPCSGFCDIPQKPYMILDSAAIENLEIFENNKDGSSSGTLYAQLNHCVTAFGKRLLRSWVARPLYHIWSIRERQEAVACLKGDAESAVLEFRKELSRLLDMERLLSRLFASCGANGRNANKVVLYEDASKKQLNEFISALRGCELLAGACSGFSVALKHLESPLLRRLLTTGEGIPDVHSFMNDLKDAFDWIEAGQTGRIIPHEGADGEYDSACKVLKDVESSLATHLKEQRKALGDASVNYVTVGKDLYLLEVPESLQGSIPRDYELRSSKKGFFRYWTPQIKKLLGDLSQAEAEKESKLKTIQQRLIERFCEHHIKWRQLVSTAAELDVLISLVIASEYYEGSSCQPKLSSSLSSSVVPCLSAKGLGHPILRSDSLGRGTFVPNDLNIGGLGHSAFILLTGPNMGGKSTLLRQVCMSVILAQIGANVPAEDFHLTPVDRIFVRMGASDNIMAGQSTFLTELSETASVLCSATRNSLVALDELGRGTSTSDGQAIAESVLNYLVDKVKCRGMFSTHYHRIAVNYQNDVQVRLCHMACQVEKGSDGVEQVTFLYRLTPGACPKSYGVNVARLAGLPESILEKAASKSMEFEETYGKKKEESESEEITASCLAEKFASILCDVGDILAKTREESQQDVVGLLLNQLHQKARLLLQQQQQQTC
ncbi:DNA mismatch repair protein msh6 [Ranunculus cassubicifolius]